MCFSAEASFVSAGVLAAIGYATLKATSNKSLLLCASVPLFFAVQQFAEGLVWLDLRNDLAHSFLTIGAKNLYLFFAYIFWPIWIPLALLVPEPQPLKRKYILFFLIVGFAVALYNLINDPLYEISPSIRNYSIHYTVEGPFYKRLFYIAVVTIPTFISSLKLVWPFGVFVAISSIITHYFYDYAFTSIWCFCAAIISIFLYVSIKQNVISPLINEPFKKNKTSHKSDQSDKS